MFVNEHIPNGGWVKYYRRKQLKETLKAWGGAFLLLAIYALAGTFDGGC